MPSDSFSEFELMVDLDKSQNNLKKEFIEEYFIIILLKSVEMSFGTFSL